MTTANTTVSNTSTTGTTGSDNPLPVATDSLDGSVSAAQTAVVQMVRLEPTERNALMALATLASALLQGSTRIQLAVLLDAITASLTLATVTAVTTVSTVTSMTQIGARDATTVVGDTMLNAWGTCVLPCIARS